MKVDYNLPTLPQHDSQSAASEVRANTNTEKIVQFRNIFFFNIYKDKNKRIIIFSLQASSGTQVNCVISVGRPTLYIYEK